MKNTILALASLVVGLGLSGSGCSTDDDDSSSGASPVGEGAFAETFGSAQCDPQLECDCPGVTQAEVDSCRTSATQNYEEALADAKAAGLKYNGKCAGEALQSNKSLGCKTYEQLDGSNDSSSCSYCDLFNGDVPNAGECEVVSVGQFEATNCAAGLRCINGLCADPCEEAQLGENCGYRQCAAGAWCDYSSEICRPLLAVGDTCEFGGCGDAAYCSYMTSVCTVLGGAGEPCEGYDTCQDGLACSGAGLCVTPGTEGQPCTQDDCSDNLRCVSNVCTPGLPDGSACDDFANECDGYCSNSVCVDGRSTPIVCN